VCVCTCLYYVYICIYIKFNLLCKINLKFCFINSDFLRLISFKCYCPNTSITDEEHSIYNVAHKLFFSRFGSHAQKLLLTDLVPSWHCA
jgi:hypothetical protein